MDGTLSKMEHLQPAAASFDEHRTCNHHPINRAINPGSIGWDEVFFVEKTATRAVVHTKPNADDCVGEIIAAGWGAGYPASDTAQIVDGSMKSPGHRKKILTTHYQESCGTLPTLRIEQPIGFVRPPHETVRRISLSSRTRSICTSFVHIVMSSWARKKSFPGPLRRRCLLVRKTSLGPGEQEPPAHAPSRASTMPTASRRSVSGSWHRSRRERRSARRTGFPVSS